MKVLLGTELKYKVTISAPGFSMDDNDWNVTITREKTRYPAVSKIFRKADCVHGQDGWYVCFDTTDFGPGQYYATITAYVPDNDFPDGHRTEVTRFSLTPEVQK